MQRAKSSAYALTLYNLYAGGLVIIILVILQDLISLGKLDLASYISILAFAIALPLLCGTLVINAVESKYQYSSPHAKILKVIHVAFGIGVTLGLVGVAAAFWHISWIAGIVFIIALVVAIVVHAAYVADLNEGDPLA